MLPSLRLFLAQAKHWLPSFSPIIDIILHCNLPQRKAILSLSRCQIVPSYPHTSESPDSYAYRQLGPTLETYVYMKHSSQTLHYLLNATSPLFSTPVSAGLINMLVRNLPLATAEEEYPIEITMGIEKEITAAISKYHPASFNWDVLLSFYQRLPGRRYPDPVFHPDYPYHWETFQRISLGFAGTIRTLQSQLFYPNLSTKIIGHVGYQACQPYLSSLQDYDYDPSVITVTDLEASKKSAYIDLHDICHTHISTVVYSRTGFEPQGPTEMGWAFKYTDLRPRCYYARGPSDYYASRYIQQVFNVLVDSLFSTHRFSRYMTEEIQSTSSHTLFIYDYSSFTSTFHEVNNFIASLARFYRGHTIQVFDTREGFLSIDLGDYLDQYLKQCNTFVEFDIGRAHIDRSYSGPHILYHNTGMLGIPGNISSCTLAHGLHLSIILQSVYLSKCVGDDAIGASIPEPRQFVFPLLLNIGHFAMSKGETWGPEDDDIDGDNPEKIWNYIKRPLCRIGGRPIQSRHLSFPPLGLLLNWTDEFHTTSSQPIETGSKEHYRRISRMLTSLVIQYDPAMFLPNEEDENVMRAFIKAIAYTMSDLAYKTRGNTRKGVHTQKFSREMKSLSESRMGGQGWFEDFWYSLEDAFIELPVPFTYSSLEHDDTLQIGVEYSVRSDRLWSTLKKMQYCEYHQRKEMYPVCEETKGLAERYFLGNYSSEYRLTLHSNIPDNLFNSIRDHTFSAGIDYVDDSDADDYDA